MAVDTTRLAPELPPARATSVAPEAARSRPVLFWAAVGAIIIAFQVYVLAKWLTGPNFAETLPGPDDASDTAKAYYLALQIGVTLATLICLYFWVVRPWRREGRMTTDGMLAISGGALFFWDMCMNFTSVQLLYNSNFFNRGAWASGSWPSWTSPNANLLPEPIFVTVPGYTCLVFAQVVFVLWLIRKVKARRPDLGVAGTIGLIVVGLTIVDSLIEILLLRSGVYAYPGGIKEITLFAGHTYQFPLSEGFLFGGLGLGAVAVLSYFRDDKGRTFAERGIERVKVGVKQRQAVKFLAIFGFVHLAFFTLYMVPNQWLATHSDPYPEGYKSYMINGMCDYPSQQPQVRQARAQAVVPCPGPGVPMWRPKSNPF